MSAPMRLDGTRVLVTGGAGFIGSNFVHRLIAQHPTAHVVVLDALTYAGRRENLDGIPADRLTFVHGDIRDPEAVARAMAGCAFVLNFAAESHVDRSIETPGEFIQTDVYGVFVLAEEARRAYEAGASEVTVRCARRGTGMSIEVADNGPGIPVAEREKLFLPYYSTKRRGSGLGLAIVRRIVAEHGGTIEAGDNAPVGTRFTIELPC